MSTKKQIEILPYIQGSIPQCKKHAANYKKKISTGESYTKKVINIHSRQNYILNITDPEIIKSLFETEKSKQCRNNDFVNHTDHKNSTKISFKNSIRQLAKETDESRLNRTEIIHCALESETLKAEQNTKMSVIESISNFVFENQDECKETQKRKTPIFDRMRDDIKPMFFFNAKNKKEEDKESNASQIDTPCFEEHLSKKNMQVESDNPKIRNIEQQTYKTKKKESTKDGINILISIPNFIKKANHLSRKCKY